jgi:hypothetical protein
MTSSAPTLTVASLTRDFLAPMCAETGALFAPIRLSKRDRLMLDLSDDGKKFVARAYQVDDEGHEGYASWEAGTNGKWWARIPERQQTLDGFKLAATDFTALIIAAVWPSDQIVFANPDAKLVYDVLLTNFVLQAGTVRNVAAHKLNGEDPAFKLIDDDALPLNKYQRVAETSSYRRPGYGLFMEQGTGKTPVVIRRICNEARALREGEFTVDHTVVKQSESVAHKYERLIEERRTELQAAAERQIEEEAKRLKAWAEERARQRMVKLTFEGRTQDLLVEVNRKIAEVAREGEEDQATISSKMHEFTMSVNTATRSKIEVAEAALRSACAAEREALSKAAVKKTPGATRMYRALIIAPKNVRVNWRNEIMRFAVTPGRVTVVRGGAIERTKLLIEAFAGDDPECEWTIVIASYESVMRSWEAFQMIKWDLCVLDESHYIKATTSKRTKRMLELRNLCEQRMCLTGTPITNSLFDLWSQFEFLGEGWSGFQSYSAFRSYYGKYVKHAGRGGNKLTGYKNVPLIRERLARMAFMITKAEAMPDLPQKTYDIVEVEMTAEQMELYEKVQTQLAIEAADEMASDKPRQLVVTNILTKLLRLAQITSGFISWDPVHGDDGEVLQPRTVDRIDPNPKLEALVELLKDKDENSKTLIWACWVQDIKSIVARLQLEGIDAVAYYGGTSDDERDSAVRRFNEDPNCKVFIGNAAAGGVGLNLLGYDYWNGANAKLSTNADHVVYYSQNWSMVHRSQSEDRNHRMGVRVSVRYTDLCVPETIDEEIRARVLDKKISAATIQDVRTIMDRVLGKVVRDDD